jgi:hypothetical protein
MDKNEEIIQVGFSKIDITPEVPCQMVGYSETYSKYSNLFQDGSKNSRTATSVLDPIYAKMLFIEDNLQLMVLDVLCIQRNFQNWILSATHNHSAPMFDTTDIWLKIFNTWRTSLVVDTAQMFLAQTTCDLNINRRRMTWRGIKTKPNPHAFRDNILTIIKFVRDHNPPIYLINYACHAGMWHGPSISADWPGRIKLDGEVVFLQGFSGDLIPDNRIGAEFKKAAITEQDMDDAGEQVARAVRKAEHRLRPCRSVFRIFNLVP